jgi:hypothetical protein
VREKSFLKIEMDRAGSFQLSTSKRNTAGNFSRQIEAKRSRQFSAAKRRKNKAQTA